MADTEYRTAGIYQEHGDAEQARDVLLAADIDDVRIEEATDGVYELRVPWPQRGRALNVLGQHVAWSVQTHT